MYENRLSVRPALVLGLSTMLLMTTYDCRVLHNFSLDGHSAVVVFNEDIGIYLICRDNSSTPVVLNASMHDLQHNANRWTRKTVDFCNDFHQANSQDGFHPQLVYFRKHVMGGTAFTIGESSTAVSFTPVNETHLPHQPFGPWETAEREMLSLKASGGCPMFSPVRTGTGRIGRMIYKFKTEKRDFAAVTELAQQERTVSGINSIVGGTGLFLMTNRCEGQELFALTCSCHEHTPLSVQKSDMTPRRRLCTAVFSEGHVGVVLATRIDDQIIILYRHQLTVHLLNQVQSLVKQPSFPFFLREDGEILAVAISNKDVAVDVLREKELVRLPLNSCSSYSTCDQCIVSRMENCGWCILENRCTIRQTCFRFNPTLTDQRILLLNALFYISIFFKIKSQHLLPMITVLVTAMLSLQPVLTMNSTPPAKINGIDCAEMEQAGPRSEKDEKQIRQVKSGILVPLHKEQHAFPVGHNYEQILACQRGHTFYFCNVNSIRLRQLDSTAIGFGDISINLDGPETSVENPQDTATAFPPWYWYPQAWLENISLSADVYCCNSPVLPRDCSRGFKLVYGDKTEIPVTAAVSETSPPTDATTDAPIDMTTMPTSSPN
ncbi:hypothetical protein BV898_00761 [Hypsibius exemplaris]|uniref:Sema domain-containing protein n=1 Tax=Hypsibius exemplaris TaxID=2072580 RepID=A0A1W0XED7_HYPEX|nr:hypothetical protein BV898_00761 [Hypsibius exemplaris]